MHFEERINLLKSAVQRMDTTQVAIKQETEKELVALPLRLMEANKLPNESGC